VALLVTKVKAVSIATGLYRPARWLVRRVRTREQRALNGDIALYRSLLPPTALCFDVGANIGEKSEALLKSGARVIAFEPNPAVIPELRARCGGYREWTLVETALGSGPRIAILHARRSHGQSSLENVWEGGDVIARFPVPVVTLDAAIECFGIPDYCKIDVEGWELEVLKGLTQRVNLISFEFHIGGNGPAKARACLERLAEFGPRRLNITQAEGSTFLFEEWIPLEEFLDRFPDKLIESLPKGSYGDIFVQGIS
jgi:FkbM family methyltransferase